jgi:uncharacterized membrane protein YoaK (UPF0700 family)
MDALSYLRAKVFTANMTGNAVVFGLGLVGPDRSRLLDCALAICAFACGAFIAGIILLRLRRPDEVKHLKFGLLLEIPFAILFTVFWAMSLDGGSAGVVQAMIFAAGCALGIQSVAVRRLNISGVVTTFITGTITTAIVSLVERRDPDVRPQKEARSSPLILAGMFALYVLGAVTGAGLGSAKSPFAGLGALMALLAVVVRVFGSRPTIRFP